MSTTENGVAARAPKTLTIPDDMDPAAMLILAACLEGLADRSAIMTVYDNYRDFNESPATFTATAPSSNWTTDPAVGEFALPSTLLATDEIIVIADFELESAGANDVWAAIGFKAASDVNNQIWSTTIRKVTSTNRERITLIGRRDCSGLGSGISLAALVVSIFLQPQGSDDATLYGPGTFSVQVIRKA